MGQSNFSQVFVYIIGGATYSEAALVAGLNKKGGPRIILGGSCIHNSESFMDDVLGQAGKDDVSIDVAEG